MHRSRPCAPVMCPLMLLVPASRDLPALCSPCRRARRHSSGRAWPLGVVSLACSPASDPRCCASCLHACRRGCP